MKINPPGVELVPYKEITACPACGCSGNIDTKQANLSEFMPSGGSDVKVLDNIYRAVDGVVRAAITAITAELELPPDRLAPYPPKLTRAVVGEITRVIGGAIPNRIPDQQSTVMRTCIRCGMVWYQKPLYVKG